MGAKHFDLDGYVRANEDIVEKAIKMWNTSTDATPQQICDKTGISLPALERIVARCRTEGVPMARKNKTWAMGQLITKLFSDPQRYGIDESRINLERIRRKKNQISTLPSKEKNK